MDEQIFDKNVFGEIMNEMGDPKGQKLSLE